jgi:hypothetical protein
MVGGFEKLGLNDYVEKTITELAPHIAVRIRATFFKIDQWNLKKGQLYVDGSFAWESAVMSGAPAISSCCCGVIGYQQGDLTEELDITVAHISSNITIRFTTNLDQAGDSSYWGINDVRLELVISHPSPPAPPLPPGTWTAIATDTWPGGATGWTGSKTLDAGAVTTCGSFGTMLGGYNVFSEDDYVEKTIDSLPTHTSVRIRADLFKIDNWGPAAKFEVYMDDVLVWESSSYTSHGDYICGSPSWNQKDLLVELDVTTAHTASSATIRFTSTVADTSDFWGLQSVSVSAVDTV